jgi:hypothetical protein
MVTVEVTNANGRSCEVHISWGWTHSSGRTDSNGRVSFDVSPGRGTILVDGDEVARDVQIEGVVQVRKR